MRRMTAAAYGLLALLATAATGCTPDRDAEDGQPIEAGDVTAGAVTAGDVEATGAVTSTGDVTVTATGDIEAGDVLAGDVSAGAVNAGAVTAGAVTAGAVSAGDVTAGDVDAGDVTASGAVSLTGPVTASGGLGIDIADLSMVIDTCNVGGPPCPDVAGFETAVANACGSGGTLESFKALDAVDNNGNTKVHLIGAVSCL